MADFMRMLLGVSLTGGIFILAAILVRAGMKNRLPKHFLVLLWAAVLVHLLIITGAPSPTSIYNYVGLRGPAALAEPPDAVQVIDPPARGALDVSLPGNGGSRWAFIAFAVWFAGAAILFFAFAFFYWMTGRRFSDAMLVKNNAVVNRWLATRKRPPKIYVSDRTATPLSHGLFRPRIILPIGFDLGDASRVESVLEHEHVHGKNYHNIMKFLVCLAVLLHWFNPFVWLYRILFNHDLELACDEQVLRAIGANRRAEYAHSLVAVAERMPATLPLTSAFNARSLRERIIDVMSFKRASAYLILPEALLVAVLFAVFGTAPANDAASGSAFPIPPQFSGWTYPEGTDALSAALSITGGGAVVKNEMEEENGKRQAEFKILSGDHEYSVTLDTRTRALVEYERKRMKKPFASVDFANFVPMDQARRLAVDALGGGKATGIELKPGKSGSFIYEIKASAGDNHYEVELDAASGAVLALERDD